MSKSTEEEARTALEALRAWLEDWRRRREGLRELENAGEDGARILEELRLSGADLGALWRGTPLDALLLPKMLEALGIDAEALARAEPAVFRDLERVCARCDKKGECRHDLAHGEPAENFDAYCANAMTLEALLAEPRRPAEIIP